MPLPYSFILGLFCLLAVEEFGDGLPRPVDPATVLPYLLLLVVPWAVARAARPVSIDPERATRRERLRALSRAVLRGLVAPGVYVLLVGPGQLYRIVTEWTDSAVLSTAVLMAPLALMEFTGELGRRQALRRALARTRGAMQLPTPFRMTMVGFLAVPLLVFAAGLDVIALDREVEVFVHGTGLGGLLGFIAFIVAMSALLPPLFRWMVPTSRQLPPDVPLTAARLGFPPQHVFELRSNLFMINAALVGPLPRLRYLFLTDGLLRLLDPFSLRGVVAHEVGHARAGHPMWLFTLFLITPLLLFQPLEVLGFGELGETEQLVWLVAMLAVGVFVMHRVAHRFEFEADQLSAEALGGATPCFLALHKIGELFGGSRTRSSFRHPSEERRLEHLLRCETDPEYLARFNRRGAWLRRAIAGALLLAILANAWAQVRVWPVERAVVAYYTGRFPEARRALEALPARLPPGRAEQVARLGAELDAASELYPEGGEWRRIRADLARRALVRARAVLLRSGAAAALPWYSLGMNQDHPTPLSLSLYHLCAARAAADAEAAARYRDHLLTGFDLEPELRAAIEREREG